MKRRPCADCGRSHNNARGIKACAIKALKDADDTMKSERRIYGTGPRPETRRGMKPLNEKKKWTGDAPTYCEICAKTMRGTAFIDGRTIYGTAWALMCEPCHAWAGRGLGLGRGQMYDLKTLEKIK